MKRFGRHIPDDTFSAERLNRERVGAETVLNQRLILYLVVFAVVIISALNSQKKILFLSLLFAGLVICWVLAYIVVIAARRVGYLAKEINAGDPEAKKIDRKGGGRSVRFLLGYFIPIFCSVLLTAAFVTGAFGFMDSYLWPVSISTTTVENKVKEVGSEIKKQIEPKKDETAGHFKSVDSVILLSKPQPESKMNMRTSMSKNFKSIDSVIALGNPPAKRKYQPSPYVPRKQTIIESTRSSAQLKNTDSLIVNVNAGKVVKKTKSISQDTSKAKVKIKPSPNFENIDSVIAKPK